jgi:Fe-S-cluster containining protein
VRADGHRTPAGSLRLGFRQEVAWDGAALHDSLTGYSHELADCGRALAAELRARPTAAAAITAVSGAGTFNPVQVESDLRQFMLLGLLDGTCDDIRTRLARLQGGASPPVQVLPESRFQCQGSGECCRGYVFGPISAEEKSRIEALDPGRALPQLGDKPLFQAMHTGAGAVTYQLATVGDACVFLEDGVRCGLHRAFGATAKPALCQLYPLAAVATIDGLRVYDRGECATFAISTRRGTLIADEVPRVRVQADLEIYHPLVRFHRSWQCDYGLVLALAARLDAELQALPPLGALHVIGHISRGFIRALESCPFEHGQPEAVVRRVLGRPADEFRPNDAAVAANARAGLRKTVLLAAALAERAAPGERHTPLFERAASQVAEICTSMLERPVRPAGGAALATSTDGETDRALGLSLRHQVFGRELLLDDSLPSGLLRMAFVVLLSLAGSHLLARDDHSTSVSPLHLSRSHMTVKRTLNRPEPRRLLRANGDQVWPILDSLPLLASALPSDRSVGHVNPESAEPQHFRP